LPGYVHDVCSGIYPLVLGSPVLRGLELDVDWVQPPAALAHPFDDGTAITLERGVAATAAQLDRDAGAYAELVGPLAEHWSAIAPVLLTPPLPPPARAALRLTRALGPAGTARSVRAALEDAGSLAARTFEGQKARALLAGNAAHSILPLERRPTGGVALTLLALGHAVGWPLARGGAQRLADALTDLLLGLGGEIRLGSTVEELPEARVVLADVGVPALLRLAHGRLPGSYVRGAARYRYGPAACKVDWALDGPIPWQADACRRAGTVHLGGTLEELAASERAPWMGRPAERPFVLLSQPSLFDQTRAPAGKHTAWAYCHVPNGWPGDVSDAIESQVERFAPGFRDLILARHVLGPRELERHNANLVGGDINGGAMTLSQALFRPVRGHLPYRTGVRGLYLCSASTPPGGGVHGMCGYNAARAALQDLG
jgi:phytoene dehydrogenase-like protein